MREVISEHFNAMMSPAESDSYNFLERENKYGGY